MRRVATDPARRMSPAALAALITADRSRGWDPCMVVATAGTTAVGAVDPLPELADLRDRDKLWLHVDAAWGGACVLSPRLRPVVAGIERADSITWDAHKWLSVPNAAGMYFGARRRPVHETFRTETRYMPETTRGGFDPYIASMQWSRRFIGLKVFLMLAELGEEGLARRIEHQAALADSLRGMLERHGWVLANDSPLAVVCFTRPEWQAAPEDVAAVAARVVGRGRAWISAITTREGIACLRACMTSFRTCAADLEILVEELELAGRDAGQTAPERSPSGSRPVRPSNG